MNCRDAIARPGTAKLDQEATTFSFAPEIDSPYTVFWDVTALSKCLKSRGELPTWMPLEGLEPWLEEGRIEIDRVHAMSRRVDPRVPILSIRFDDGILPVDGWHRIFQALKRGWKTIPTLLLEGEEEYRFRYPQPLCDRLRDLSQDPGYRLLEQFLENSLRAGKQVSVFGI